MGAISDGSANIFTKRADGTQIDIAKENRLRGNEKHSLLGLTLTQGLPQLLAGGAMSIGSKIENKNNENISEESKDETIKELQKQRHVLMEQIGTESTDDFNRIQNQKLEEIKSLQAERDDEVKAGTAVVDGLYSELGELGETLNGKLAELAGATEENKSSIEAEIKQIKADIKAKEKEIKTAEADVKKIATEYANEINNLGKEYNNISEKMQKVLDLDRQISNYQDGGVSSKTDDLKKFNKVADAYRKAVKNPDDEKSLKEAAKNLKDTYEAMGADVSPSITKLYELYRGDIEQLTNKK